MKRFFSCLLLLLLLISAMVPHAQAADLDVSGDLDNSKPTKAQISGKWYEVTTAKAVYAEEPSVAAPYAVGQLSDDFLQSGITYLNYVRYVANLPQVQLSDELNEDAQHGAVLLAAVDTLTHYPERPSDMDKNFYKKGYNATSSSNLSAKYDLAPRLCLQGSVSECMTDFGSVSNLSYVGHRRWLLNPKLLNVGFGYARSNSGWQYITTEVLDTRGSGCDYDFISWPASGNHPTNLFNVYAPWSVTLNPKKYKNPRLKNLKITITREADGKVWTFDASTGEPVSSDDPYLKVDLSGYGVSNCIIFHPGARNVDSYRGVYTVDISGLYTTAGKAAKLHYQVDFFDVQDLSDYTGGTIKKVDGVWKYYYEDVHLPVTTLVEHSGSWYYVREGLVDFDYVGFLECSDGQYYVKNGKIISHTTGLVKSEGAWFYVVNGKLEENTTELIKHNGEWFYVVNGKVASDTTTLIEYNGGRYYILKGKLAGKTTALVKCNGEWYYVVAGKVASDTTTLVLFNGGWYYIYKGELAANTTTLVKYCGTWYYVQNGKVDFTYTGPFRFNGGTYQIKNGKIA